MGKIRTCLVVLIMVSVMAIFSCFFFYRVYRYDIGIKSTYFRWNEMSETSEEWKVCSRENDSLLYPERLTNYKNWTRDYLKWKQLRLKLMTDKLDGEDHLLIYKNVVEPTSMVFSKQSRAELKKNTYRIGYQKDCAIIGNSGILLRSNCGHEIDSHSMVVRMSLNPIAKFSRDAGTKTNITYINKSMLRKIRDRLTAKDDRYCTLEKLRFLNDSIFWYALGLNGLTFHDGDGDEENKQYRLLAQTLKGDLGLPIQLAFSLHSIKVDSSRLWSLGNPSSGYNVLTWALTACQRIDLYGFFPFHHDAYCRPVQYHYAEPNATMNYPRSIHRWREEFLQLKQLHQQGVLRLVTGQCPHPGRRQSARPWPG